jgi:mono/diheme cytochrome c family protein
MRLDARRGERDGSRASIRRGSRVTSTHKFAAATIALAFVALAFATLSRPALAQDVSFGDRLYHEKADCQFCHGPDGDGRGDPRSPGQAANLHKTILNREQLVEVIACGRPGTEMPHFDKYAYEDKTCYGATAADLGDSTPHDPHSTPLTKREIEAVADFLMKTYVGK